MTEQPDRDETTGRFLTGNIGGGRPKGARSKLGEAFIQALQEDFDENGVDAIAVVRAEKPDQYLKVIASLLPKDVNLNLNNEIEMTDDEIRDRIRGLANQLAPFLGRAGNTDTGIEAAAIAAKPDRLH